MPVLHPKRGAGAIRLEQGGEAFGAAAPLRVGVAPEWWHGLQGIEEGLLQALGIAGMAQGLTDAAEQGGAARLVGGPGGGPVLVVEGD